MWLLPRQNAPILSRQCGFFSFLVFLVTWMQIVTRRYTWCDRILCAPRPSHCLWLAIFRTKGGRNMHNVIVVIVFGDFQVLAIWCNLFLTLELHQLVESFGFETGTGAPHAPSAQVQPPRLEGFPQGFPPGFGGAFPFGAPAGCLSRPGDQDNPAG